MKSSLLLKCILSSVLSGIVSYSAGVRPELDELWESYKETFKKHYLAMDDKARRMIWQQNVDLISQHNAEYDLGLHNFKLKMNHLTDMEQEEVMIQQNAYVQESMLWQFAIEFTPSHDVDSFPESVNWRDEKLVTEVKDQVSCGSDWAFAAIGALESQVAKKKGQLISLSEQNLVDCSYDQGNQGCGGGSMISAYNYIIENNGINDGLSYMYAGANLHCFFNPKHIAATMKSYIVLPSGDEVALQEAVATIGPIAAAVDANSRLFHLYGGGIYVDDTCSDSGLNRAVLVVGYGSENGVDYWLVKNSWGPEWGEDGYIRMARNHGNQCGIASAAIYPVID